ncbi:uncharacterized protein LOC141696133 [Apium graveolens]|uniref:uncharacterized protein LOC141696133 n=1 Tax=Apium graveolens TaxID=4045 RepID=UPI003D7B4171
MVQSADFPFATTGKFSFITTSCSIDCSGPVVTSYGGTHSHLPSCLGYFSQKIWSHYSEFQAAVEALAFLDCLHSLAIEPMQLCTIEAMGDAINNALEGDEEEEETEELVSQVLDEIGININSELVNAPSATIAPDAKNKVAMAMAAKAKLLLRELKTVKADLAFAKELCGQLEEENSVIRESRAAGGSPEDDDLLRIFTPVTSFYFCYHLSL